MEKLHGVTMKTDTNSNTHVTLNGLHHVTAVTARARENVDFYTRVLGMRLVKKTVNQDDVSAYHLFYADAIASPGTDLTFFDWGDIRPARRGAGITTETSLRVLGGEESLKHWIDWFRKEGVQHGGIVEQSGLPSLPFMDAEGQKLRLVAENHAGNKEEFHPWKASPVPLDAAIVGLGSVTLTVADVDSTTAFLTEVLGFRERSQKPENGLLVLDTGIGGPGAELRVEGASHYGGQGAGGVHHVAWRVPDVAHLLAWQAHLEEAGIGTSGKVNRHYFQSLYFRIPGGILFEIATDGPGFTADGEALEHLGEKLALPPFLEPRRAEIEAGLKPLE